jgi:hypothetical protein
MGLVSNGVLLAGMDKDIQNKVTDFIRRPCLRVIRLAARSAHLIYYKYSFLINKQYILIAELDLDALKPVTMLYLVDL